MFPIFEKLGGLDEALKLLRPQAIRDTWPSEHTLKDWIKKRRALPSIVVHKLMTVCDERGIAYQLSDFRLPSKTETT